MFLNKINGPDFVHTNEAHFKKRSRELHFIEYISNTLTRLGTITQMAGLQMSFWVHIIYPNGI